MNERPIVECSPVISRHLGQPFVDYDALTELYHGDLQIPDTVQPTIKLKTLMPGMFGMHMPFSHSVTIDPIKCVSRGGEFGLSNVLLHESQHLADSVNHPVRTAATVITRFGVYAGTRFGALYAMRHGVVPDPGNGFSHLMQVDGSTVGEAVSFGIDWVLARRLGALAGKQYYKIDPAEHSARKTQHARELVHKYRSAITFPGMRPRLIHIGWAH